jgi:hypothetical protein
MCPFAKGKGKGKGKGTGMRHYMPLRSPTLRAAMAAARAAEAAAAEALRVEEAAARRAHLWGLMGTEVEEADDFRVGLDGPIGFTLLCNIESTICGIRAVCARLVVGDVWLTRVHGEFRLLDGFSLWDYGLTSDCELEYGVD